MKEASLSIIEDTKNHKFLMIRHHRGINKGCINFPGGKRENGESMEDILWKLMMADIEQKLWNDNHKE